jgi:SAM-dependent methyltransferase
MSAINLVKRFYHTLRDEVVNGNPALVVADQTRLRSHYPVMLSPNNPVELAATIYAQRRQYPVAAILATSRPVVFDAGCGYGSESFLFASLGARVIAVDIDAEKIRIARLRQPYYESIFEKKLAIEFQVADLDTYVPPINDLSLTWLASVLAAIPNQDRFLQVVFDATRPGGQVMISDMNLWNPLFLFGEWRRRERAKRVNAAFAQNADFGAMLNRHGRIGARYFTAAEGHLFDDVQFFSPATLKRLLCQVGFHSIQFHFSGFIPPLLARLGLTRGELLCARVPGIAHMGYFYLGIGHK